LRGKKAEIEPSVAVTLRGNRRRDITHHYVLPLALFVDLLLGVVTGRMGPDFPKFRFLADISSSPARRGIEAVGHPCACADSLLD
jgi:hypothetical protein